MSSTFHSSAPMLPEDNTLRNKVHVLVSAWSKDYANGSMVICPVRGNLVKCRRKSGVNEKTYSKAYFFTVRNCIGSQWNFCHFED